MQPASLSIGADTHFGASRLSEHWLTVDEGVWNDGLKKEAKENHKKKKSAFYFLSSKGLLAALYTFATN